MKGTVIMLGIIMGFAGMSCHRPDPAKPAAGVSTSQDAGPATGNAAADAAGATKADADGFPSAMLDESLATESGRREVVLAGGCFWCTEAVFEKLDGVLDVISGYAGGTKATAKYDVVSMGGTDHAEAIRIVYDPSKITLGQLLKVFFNIAHDPTQLNRQGADVGRQYRSTVFFADAQQEKIARGYIAQLNQAKVFKQPIVTTLEPLEEFFLAEQYHQDFVVRNPNQPYVQGVALPKVDKLQEKYPDKLKQ